MLRVLELFWEAVWAKDIGNLCSKPTLKEANRSWVYSFD